MVPRDHARNDEVTAALPSEAHPAAVAAGVSRLSKLPRRRVAQVLEALYEGDALDMQTVEAAFTAESDL